MKVAFGRSVWLPLFLVFCVPSASQETGICQRARTELSNSDRIAQRVTGPLEQFLNENKLMFSDPDAFESAMQTWDSRLKWAKRNVANLKQVFLALDSRRDLSLVLVSYGQISMVFKPAEAGQAKVYISLMDMHYPSQSDILKMPCAGEPCGQWYISAPRRQADPYPLLASRGDTISVIRVGGETLCFRLELIYSKQPLPDEAGFWADPQAYEIRDFNEKTGRQVGTGQFMPDPLSIRLCEADFPELEKGRMTEDFMLKPAAPSKP